MLSQLSLGCLAILHVTLNNCWIVIVKWTNLDVIMVCHLPKPYHAITAKIYDIALEDSFSFCDMFFKVLGNDKIYISFSTMEHQRFAKLNRLFITYD